MLRHCNGADANLIYDAPCTREDCPQTPTGTHTHPKPCNCGKRFDDVYHFVIFPHAKF